MKKNINNKIDFDEIFIQIAKDKNLKSNKSLGSGAFGKVYEVELDKMNKFLAAKLIKDEEKKENESELILELRGPNIVKVNKIYEKKISEEKYSLILMEKADLKDLKTFVKQLREGKILKYVFKNPFEMIGDNFSRFIIKQLVKGFETLYIANFSHFDFKPENTLIFKDIVMKLSDFGLLRNLNKLKNDKNIVKVPGGTQGYYPPEIYSNNGKIKFEEATTIDYFSLGATIFYLKYGDKMLKFEEFKDNLETANYMIDLMQRAFDKIKTTKSNDKDFIHFLCKLIQYDPKDRLSFEEIQRNKWLNKNWNEILEVVETNQANEEKLIEELNKTDFLFEKKNYLNEKRKLRDEININAKDKIEDNKNNDDNKDNKNKNERNQKNKVNYHKFRLKL